MINRCARHILCPPGSSTDTPGTNYSSEHIDVPEYDVVYYPPTEYGTYTACQNRCVSTISQEAAELCAQRLGKLCLNDHTTGKPTYGNTPQVCTIPNTGKTVIVPADVFFADSQAEANAQALSYANGQQVLPTTPPVKTVPPPTTGTGPSGPPNTIPTPTPQQHQEPPPQTSECLPCDDTGAVSTFTKVCDVPADTQTMLFESPPLKCGRWHFAIATNDGGGVDDGQSVVTLSLAAANPSRTPIDMSMLDDCPSPGISFYNPCDNSLNCDGTATVLEWGYLACCGTKSANCKWVECQTLEDGSHWMCVLIIEYATAFPTGNSAKKFTITGTLTDPLPSAP